MEYIAIEATEEGGLAGFAEMQPIAVRFRFKHPGRIGEDWRLPFVWKAADGSLERPVDFLGTLERIRLVSRKFRDVVEPLLGERDEVEWIAAPFTAPGGVEYEYFIPHFPDQFDMYDETYTDWGPSGLPIRWVLSRAKLDGHVFFAPVGVSEVIIVRDDVLAAMADADLTGVAYGPPRIQ